MAHNFCYLKFKSSYLIYIALLYNEIIMETACCRSFGNKENLRYYDTSVWNISHQCTSNVYSKQSIHNMTHRLNYFPGTDILFLQGHESNYYLILTMNLYNFDNNTKLICNQIESKIIYRNSKILEAEEDSTDKAYIYYYNNMTYQTTCKGKHSTWLLLNDHNRIVGIQKENRVNLNISEHSRMICIDYECYNMNSINTTLCTRVIRKDLTFISYEYDSNSSYNKLITVSIITFVVLVGIILILLSALLCCIFKKPRPPMPLPEQATDSNILYSEIYDHINRI